MRNKLTRRDVLRTLLGLAAAISPVAVLTRPALAKAEGWVAGTVKFFDARRGYGFIVADDGADDVLLHITCLRASGYESAPEGARIECVALHRARGRQAFRVLSLGRAPGEPARYDSPVEVRWFNRERGFGFLRSGERTGEQFVHLETLRRFQG